MSTQNLNQIYTLIGPAGVVLLFLVIIALYLSIKNIFYFIIVWRGFKKNFLTLEKDECCSLDSFTDAKKNPLIGILVEIMTHRKHSEDIRAEVNYLFYRNFEKVTRDLTYIRVISVISPLLGLLGTVMGMVTVFDGIAGSTAPDPTILAAGISSALATTIMGLTVAVPALLAYYILMLRFKGFQIEAVEHSYRIIDLCGEKE